MLRRRLAPHQKFLALSGSLLGLTAVVTLVSVVALWMVESDTEQLVGRDIHSMGALLRLDRDLTEIHQFIIESTHTDQARRKLLVSRADERMESLLDNLKQVKTLERGNVKATKQVVAFEADCVEWMKGVAQLRDAPGSEQVSLVVKAFDEGYEALHTQAHSIETDLYEKQIDRASVRLHNGLDMFRSVLLWVGLLGIGVGGSASWVIANSMRKRQAEIDRQAKEQDRYNEEQQLVGRLAQAMEMVEREEDIYRLVEEILKSKSPETKTELLVADSSRAHMSQVATTDEDMRGPGCGVKSPRQCQAVRQGKTQIYADSQQFDACPYLRNRGWEPCAAACVPLTIMGQAAGVMHSTALAVEVFDDNTQRLMSNLAVRAGERIGMMRAFAQSQTQASTDPLTGLLNRRSFQDRAAELMRSGKRFAAVYCDLDHFKKLNDEHGHDVGDRALRLFSKVLKDSIRPGDLASRWGGEEFVLVLSDVSAEEAVTALERIRQSLSTAQSSGNTPTFTVSMGVCESILFDEIEGVLAAADDALLMAKRTGRDKIVVSGETVETPQAQEPDGRDESNPVEEEVDALFEGEADGVGALDEADEAEPESDETEMIDGATI